MTDVLLCVFAAHFCLIHLLLQRHPNLFFNHFIESIFYFNNYEGHTGKLLLAYVFVVVQVCY